MPHVELSRAALHRPWSVEARLVSYQAKEAQCSPPPTPRRWRLRFTRNPFRNVAGQSRLHCRRVRGGRSLRDFFGCCGGLATLGWPIVAPPTRVGGSYTGSLEACRFRFYALLLQFLLYILFPHEKGAGGSFQRIVSAGHEIRILPPSPFSFSAKSFCEVT